MIKMLSPSKITLLEACRTPQSYSALRAKLKISETAFLNHLTELKNKGLVVKQEDKMYYLTDKARRTFRENKVLSRITEMIETDEGLERLERFLNDIT